MWQFKDVSIKKKLYFIVAAMAILILVELITLWFSIHTLSSVRALVGAEGLWSKAQKDGIYYLGKYSRTFNEEDYQEFLRHLSVPLGDHKTRMELFKADPDFNIAKQGFLEGRVHSDDIDGIIKLLRRFHNVYYLKKAITAWTQGDSLLLKLIATGEKIHTEINSSSFSKENLDSLVSQIDPLNNQITALEDNFSFTLGEGSRWLENIILSLLFTVALTVEITGLALSISITRSITKGLSSIITASKRISKGDLTGRADVYSKDEIGQVATSVNQMTEQLITSNLELGQFAYIASHDLQEPLRTISNYSGLLQKRYAGYLDENGNKYLASIEKATMRMQSLIKDLLDYSTIGNVKTTANIDCNILLQEVISDMTALIEETNTTIEYGDLPLIEAYPEIRMLFQNLISNAIKFRKPETPMVIKISSADYETEWLFTVSDNGIGIEEMYYERIFTIFQRLHSNKEYQGTGIGLAQCKKIVELHGGEIHVNSEYGKGSTFYFTLRKILLHEKIRFHIAD
jgi:signal transduction histidine kinase